MESSESSDEEYELNDDLNSNSKKKKIIKKCSDNSNTLKKTSNKSRSIKNLPSPSVPPVFSEKFIVSPNKITRQHTPQYSKQSKFSISVAKDSGRNHANFVKKITLQKNQKDEEMKKEILEKLKQQKQNKQKFKKARKDNSEKECFTIEKAISEKQEKDDGKELSNFSSNTPSKNLSIDESRSSLTDTLVASPSTSNKIYTPTKLRTSSPIRSYTSQSVRKNLFKSQEHGESLHDVSSVSEVNENQNISEKDQFTCNAEEIHLQVTKFPLLKNMIHKGFSEIKKEISILNSKMDICLMNQEKLNRFLLPGEKVIKRPSNFPSLPVDTEAQLNSLENFLKDDGNLSAAELYYKALKVNL